MMWREVKTNRNQLLWDKILWFCTAWRKINLPKLRTPTCSTPAVSMTTSPWGWSAPASWKSTRFRSISRTAPWPLAHTFTLVRSSDTACRRLCLQTSHPELRSALLAAADVRMVEGTTAEKILQESTEVLHSSGEWEFVHISVSHSSLEFDEGKYSAIKYFVSYFIRIITIMVT